MNQELNEAIFPEEIAKLAEKFETLCCQDEVSYHTAMLAMAALVIKMSSNMLKILSEKELLKDLQAWANLITARIPFKGEDP